MRSLVQLSAPQAPIGYASRTGTRRNLDALREHGWRLLVSARGCWRAEGFPYAIDNGAWTAYQRGEPFDVARFEGLVARMGASADWIVAPDIVGGGAASLELSLRWLERLASVGPPILVPVQEGIDPHELAPVLGPGVGIFVGGAAASWKERTMAAWAELARSRGAYCHVGRVNTGRRVAICAAAGVHSFDGSGPSRRAIKTVQLDRWRRQRAWMF